MVSWLAVSACWIVIVACMLGAPGLPGAPGVPGVPGAPGLPGPPPWPAMPTEEHSPVYPAAAWLAAPGVGGGGGVAPTLPRMLKSAGPGPLVPVRGRGVQGENKGGARHKKETPPLPLA